MKFFWSKQDDTLEQAIAQLRDEQPDAKTLAVSAERVWKKLQDAAGEEMLADAGQPIRGCVDIRGLLPAFYAQELPPARALIVEDHLRECVACRSYAHGRAAAAGTNVNWHVERASRVFRLNWAAVSLAAASIVVIALVYAGISWYFAPLPGNRAQVASIQGQAYRVSATGVSVLRKGDEIADGEFVRTAAGSRAILALYDGSHVEMNQRAELSVNATRRNATIHLDQGVIIVRAVQRHTGHLYVSAPDCTVAVTGTMFSVNSGTKGSRVAVIQGEVRVKHSGAESILHSGDVMATTPTVGVVPIQEEIGWSSNRDEDLALLAALGKLRASLNDIPMPPPRYQSNILPLLSADTVLYVGIPNLGDALQQANQIFQQQLAQSKALQDWWNKNGNANQHPTPAELINEIQTMSQYLGDEVVITVGGDASSLHHSPLLLAEVRQAGLKDFLQNHLAGTLAAQGHPVASDLKVVDPPALAALAPQTNGMIMLVRPNMLVIGGDAASVQRMNAQLDTRGGLFAETDFGRRILGVYSQGAETLVAVNMGQILAATHEGSEQAALQNSGFADVKYLIATRSDNSNQPGNRLTLEFAGQRHGIASWLAAPSPIGSLDYVSANAGAALSFATKQPAAMLDDLFNTINTGNSNPGDEITKVDSELGIDIRNDIAGALGGDLTIALDGPVLPTPSWKLIVEVNNPGALQLAIEKIVQDANLRAANANQPGLTLTPQQSGGRTFYTVRSQAVGDASECDYVFADGYLIVAPSRALLLAAIQTRANGTSLARSPSFLALLPSDNQANFSGMFYQNLAPVLQPIASQLTSQQFALLQKFAADSKPSVMCAYGESDRIEVASNGKLLDLNPSSLALLHLLGLSEHGTSRGTNP